ncbi:MAG: N-6 DNA methylase [Planctomycetes bacterium]|nr:N-6 DNA methylase [Planctomycetota bacterium]
MLFTDSRKLGRVVDRTHRELTGEDIARIARSCHAWRGEEDAGEYADAAGFCRNAPLEEVRKHGHVLTTGRYVGAEAQQDDGEPFDQKMQQLAAQMRDQQAEAARLDAAIAANLRELGMAGRKKTSKVPVRAVVPARGSRGRTREGASFPVPPPRAELSRDYGETLNAIKQRIQEERLRVVLAANSAMVLLCWDIGRMILDRQQREGWGARVIDRLAADLRESYPDMKGLSARNLLFMRSLAEVCPDAEKTKQLVSRLPWGHVIRLLQRVKESDVREWYMRECIEHGWSRSILELQIDGRGDRRRRVRGRAVSSTRGAGILPARFRREGVNALAGEAGLPRPPQACTARRMEAHDGHA